MAGETYSKKALVIVNTLTGNTYSYVDFLKKSYVEYEFVVMTPRQVKRDGIELDYGKYDKIFIGTYTWGNGEIPIHIQEFMDNHGSGISTEKVLLFGSGQTVYEHFCGALDRLASLMDIPSERVVKFELYLDKGNPMYEDAVVQTDKFMRGKVRENGQ